MTNSPAAVSEKRRHARKPLGLSLDIQVSGQPNQKVRGSISDVSESGMSLKTTAELEDGMCLHLRLNNSLDIRGEIRHIKDSKSDGFRRYGVRFHKFGPRQVMQSGETQQ